MEAFQVNPNIILALNMLHEAGFDAYIVGGAVRDFILDLPVSDYDIATNANLDQAMEVFKDYECKKYISKNITIGHRFSAYNTIFIGVNGVYGKNIRFTALKNIPTHVGKHIMQENISSNIG